MSLEPCITVLCGSASEEAEVSRKSGRALAQALESWSHVRLIDLPDNELPDGLDPETTVIFPALHGTFGEDGQLQKLLEERGFAYAGSDAQASSLCMNKVATKKTVANTGFSFARDLCFQAESAPTVEELVEALGDEMVIKPMDKGSSVGLHIVRDATQLQGVLDSLETGPWMAESMLIGREMTVGLLDGVAMGVVEIVPNAGVYDYAHKYTVGATEYRFPASISDDLADRVRSYAAEAYRLCGCRDFARLDFILSENGVPYFLEINTLPGLTQTSLLPKSASCVGLDFEELARRMIAPAIQRFRCR